MIMNIEYDASPMSEIVIPRDNDRGRLNQNDDDHKLMEIVRTLTCTYIVYTYYILIAVG